MGLFGGGNSSSNTTETQLTQTGYGQNTSNASFNNVKIDRYGTLNLESTDYGAIQSGLALSQSALQSNNEALSQAFGQSAAVVNKTLQIASQNQVDQSTQFQGTLIKIIAIVGGVIAFVMLARSSS